MPLHFLRLPREIRDAILELCLVVGGPIVPYPEFDRDRNPFKEADRKPDVALLKVNKGISAEASKILYSRNLWKVTWRPEDGLEVVNDSAQNSSVGKAPLNKIWHIHRAHIRYVTLDFVLLPRGIISTHYLAKLSKIRRRKMHTIREMQVKSAYISIQNFETWDSLQERDCIDLLMDWANFLEAGLKQKAGEPSAELSVPKVKVVGFRDRAAMRKESEWWEYLYGRRLDRVIGTDGQQVGLAGFFDHVGRR